MKKKQRMQGLLIKMLCIFMNAIYQITASSVHIQRFAKGIKYYDALKIMNEKGKASFFEVHEHEH